MTIFRSRASRARALLLVLLCPSFAMAQTLSLTDAIELARLHHPSSTAFAAETSAAQLQAESAALPPGFAL